MKRNKKNAAGRRKRPGVAAKLAVGLVTCVNLALTLALAVQRRRDVVRAVRDDERVKVLLERGTKEE